MNKLAPLTALLALALAACGEEAATPPAEAPAPAAAPSLPPADRDIFTEVYARECPEAEPVSTALCKSRGLAGVGFVCDFGLGEDEYRRHMATLVPGDGEWQLEDPETACAIGAE